jgi:photosystem II stability/assembly factor-like uncharacterized protein
MSAFAMKLRNFRCLATFTLACICAAPILSQADTKTEPGKDKANWTDPLGAPAEIMPLAAQSLVLDVARSGEHYVAVGARGAVLLSDDGRSWRQSAIATRTTFTSVAAVDAQVWAVGHDGVIVHSADGGEHWEIQRQDPWKAADDGNDASRDSRQGAPLLDVFFLDAHRGYAVGAYSLALKTTDGGATWQNLTVAQAKSTAEEADEEAKAAKGEHGGKQTFSKDELVLGQESTPHLNAITRTGGGALFIVGERGSAFRSRDDGATWQRSQLPYDGSMFGVIGYEGDHVLAFGLRGHVYESSDLGAHWTKLETGTELSLMGGTALPGGGCAIVGANGIVLTRAHAGEALKSYVDQTAGVIAAVLPFGDDGTLLVAGENGISLIPSSSINRLD